MNRISVCLLLILIISTNELLGNEFNDLSLPKELVSNTLSLVHLQSNLMIMTSERDFPFNISSDYKLNYVRYPQSYRTTLVQVSSDMYKLFSNIYSTMYRIQLAVPRIPSYIKTIIKLMTGSSSAMIRRMLPSSFDNIARISEENKHFINNIIDQLTKLLDFINEIKQLPIDLSLKFNKYPSQKTDLIPYNRLDSKDILENISVLIQKMQKQFQQFAQLLANLNIKTKLNLSINNNMTDFIPILYNIEMNAYFIHDLSSIYTDVLSRYVLDQTAGMGRYVVLSTDEERSTTISNLSKQLLNVLHQMEQIFIERQNEFEINSTTVRQAYEKLFNEFQDRSLTSKLLENK